MEEPLMQLNSSITPTRTVMTYSHRNCPSHPIQSQAGGNGAEGLMQEADEKPFELKGLDIAVPKGSFVAIVGRVGLGKVSQLMWVHLAGLTLCLFFFRVQSFRR
jgi:ABC-type transport system involved in cytochrome bd biosynthesis fused ATPase/permease subunit